MTLVAARQRFVERSGRYDLVTDTINWGDAGADSFIRAGQRWLERSFTLFQSEARSFFPLAQGAWFQFIPDCRAVQEVWVSSALGTKWKLTRRDYGDLLFSVNLNQQQNPDPTLPMSVYSGGVLKDPAQLGKGAPINYSPVVLRTVPDTPGSVTIDTFGPVSYTSAGSQGGLDGVVFLPPVDSGYVLEVKGLFYHPKLVNDADLNFWTEQEEFILVLAACRAVEVTLRNQQGVADWESAIRNELQGLEFDWIEESSSEMRCLNG